MKKSGSRIVGTRCTNYAGQGPAPSVILRMLVPELQARVCKYSSTLGVAPVPGRRPTSSPLLPPTSRSPPRSAPPPSHPTAPAPGRASPPRAAPCGLPPRSAPATAPRARFVPSSMVIGRSVFSRSVRHGTPSTVVSSCKPPRIREHHRRAIGQRQKLQIPERLHQPQPRRRRRARTPPSACASAGALERAPGRHAASSLIAPQQLPEHASARRRSTGGAG